jgi:hypothetical protein
LSHPQNKKKAEIGFLAAIILLLVSVGVVAAVYKAAFAGLDQKTAELNCRSFNVIRFAIEKGAKDDGIGSQILAKQFNAPRICPTFDKKGTVPTKDYQDQKIGKETQAASEIRDMMARCWWMWLEGKQQNIFQRGVFDLKDGCFICYTFAINKDVSVGYTHIIDSLQKSYPRTTLSDNCKKPEGYGECRPGCFDKETEMRSSSCTDSQKPKCCVASFSYLDYIQGTNGAPTGKGLILVTDKEPILAKDKMYAISIVSPAPSWTLNSAAYTGGAVGSLAGGLAATMLVSSYLLAAPITVTATVVGIGLTSYAGYFGFTEAASVSGEVKPNNYNYILLSKHDDVQKYCYAEKSYGQ